MTTDLLETLREHVAEDRVAAALETVDEVEAAFAADRRRTSGVDTLATTVRYRTDGDSAAAAAADDHLSAATDLEQRRIELNQAVLGYLTDETPAATLVDRLDATIDGYEGLTAKREALLEAAESVAMGVLLHLERVDGVQIPLGDEVEVSTTLANLGDQPSSALSVTTRSDDLVAADPSPTGLDGLGPGDRATIDVVLSGQTTGRGRVRVAIEGDDRVSTPVRVEVLDRSDYVEDALGIADRLLADVERRLDDAASPGLRGLHQRLVELRRRLVQLLDRLEDDPSKGRDADHRLASLVARFESLIKTLEDAPAGFDERVLAEYVRLCRDAIDALKASRDAEP